MLKILRDIRAVAGVTGVAVLVKRDGRAEHLFPAAFTERHTAELLKLVTAAYQRLRGFSRLYLRFDRVTVHLLNQPEYLLLITVLPDIDQEIFETVVNSKISAIARSVAGSEGARAGGPAERGADHAVIDILLAACNGTTRRTSSSLGLSRMASAWRGARDAAAAGQSALSAVDVDPAGQLSLRKGRLLTPSPATIEGLASMIEQFLDNLGTRRTDAEATFYGLLEPHRDLLERHGFFQFLCPAAGHGGRGTRAPQSAPR